MILVFLGICNLTSVTYADCQKYNSKQTRKGSVNVSKVAPSIAVALQKLPADLKLKAAQAFVKTEVACPVVWESNKTLQRGTAVKGFCDDPQTGKENTEVPSQAQKFAKRGCLPLKFLIFKHDNIDQFCH